MGDPEPNMNERAEEAFAERTLLGVTDEEWHSAMGHVCAMAANGSKLGASILLIKAVREAVKQEREAYRELWTAAARVALSNGFDAAYPANLAALQSMVQSTRSRAR